MFQMGWYLGWFLQQQLELVLVGGPLAAGSSAAEPFLAGSFAAGPLVAGTFVAGPFVAGW